MFPASLHELKDQLSRQELQRSVKHWKNLLSKLSFAEKRSALRLPEAIAELGAARIAEMIRHIDTRHELLIDRVPSANWHDLGYHDGEAFPVPGMVLSDQKVRFHPNGSDAVIGKKRFMPAQNLGQEDYLDGMTMREALCDPYDAPSPSARAIQLHQYYTADGLAGASGLP